MQRVNLKKLLVENKIVWALLFLIFLWFLWKIRVVLVIVFLAYLVDVIFLPLVRWLERKKVPRLVAVLIPYLIVALLLFLLVYFLTPFFTIQLPGFLISFPTYLVRVLTSLNFRLDQEQLISLAEGQIAMVTRGLLALTSNILRVWVAIIATLVLSFYFLYYFDQARDRLALWAGNQGEKLRQVWEKAGQKLGLWAVGEIIDVGVVALLVFLGLWFVGLEFAFPLAIFAGILELIPSIGLILAVTPALIVAASHSFLKVLEVLLVYLLASLLESHVIVPQIMRQSVGLNPGVVIVAVLIGGELGGILGAFLAIPVAALILGIIQSFQEKKAEQS